MINYERNVYTWGDNTNGQLGIGTTEIIKAPILHPLLPNKKVKDMKSKGSINLCLLDDGKALLISCMGDDDWQIRAQTVQILANLSSNWAVKLIHHACMDYDIRVRMEAIEIVRRQIAVEEGQQCP